MFVIELQALSSEPLPLVRLWLAFPVWKLQEPTQSFYPHRLYFLRHLLLTYLERSCCAAEVVEAADSTVDALFPS